MEEAIRKLIADDEQMVKMMRFCRVAPEDMADLRQEVSVLLLQANPTKIAHLGNYTIGIIKRLYYGQNSKYWKMYKDYANRKTSISDIQEPER